MGDFTSYNLVNSLASMVGQALLDAGYLVAWQERDAVETPDGWYFNWDSNYTGYMANSTFLARWTAGKGLVSLVEGFATEPRFIERPIAEAGPIPQHEVLVPALSIDVGPAVAIRLAELGSPMQWWNRTLMVEGFLRNRAELRVFADFMAQWFQEPVPVRVHRHDDGSLTDLGLVQILDTVTETEIDLADSNQLVYHMVCTARIEYAA